MTFVQHIFIPQFQNFALFTLSLVFLWTLWNYTKPTKKPQLPPGPRGLPVVGYLPFLRPNLHHQFTDLARVYGPIFKLKLGSKLFVVVNSPPLVKEVVRNQDAVFASRDPPIAALIGTYGGRNIAFASYGPQWRDSRKVVVREMLSQANMRACYALRRDEVRKTVASVRAREGQHVKIGELALSTEMNVVTRMIWGNILRGDEEKLRKFDEVFGAKMDTFVHLLWEANISDFMPWLARFDLQGVKKRMEDTMKAIDGILESILNEGIKIVSEKSQKVTKNDENKDFLQILLELKDTEAGKSLDRETIKGLLLDIVIGGTDTTATMTEWVMTALLDNPTIMKKVQKELDEVVGANNSVEESHLAKLIYLDAVVKESFRLFPPLPLLVPRCPTETTQVGGYTIPKGTRVFLNMYFIHRDPQLWDNPLVFMPERFLNQNLDYNGNDVRFLPFGAGRRICAGIPLAEKMLLYILGSLLHSFDWNVPNGEKIDFSDEFGILIKKSTPLVAIPYPRLPS